METKYYIFDKIINQMVECDEATYYNGPDIVEKNASLIDDAIHEVVDKRTGDILRKFSFKYVEDYREEDMTDDQVISAALRDLGDYETLVFGSIPGQVYKLENPVILTQTNDSNTGEIIYKEKIGITLFGRGCTITNGVKDASLYPWLSNPSSSLFILSDDKGNGLTECTITGFKFSPSDISSVKLSSRFSGIRCTTAIGSTYLNRCKITNCNFRNLSTGIYACGKDNDYSLNEFNACYIGVYDDGSIQAKYHDNYFFITQNKGILAQQSYDTTIEHNVFYKCRGDAISLSGTQPRIMNDSTSIKCIVSKNIIRGSGHFLVDNKKTVENGIVSYGYKDLIISNNIIHSMATNKTDDPYSTYGYGILIGGGYNNQSSCRMSSRVLVESNEIYAPAREGIRVRYANDVLITNNSIYGYGGDAFGGEGRQSAAISNSLSTDIVIKGNIIHNYKYLESNDIVDISVSYTESDKNRVCDNTSIEGMTWADTRRHKKDPTALEIIDTANMNVVLREGITYTVWIPAVNTDPETKDEEGNISNYSHILYQSIDYLFKSTTGILKIIKNPVGYGYFQDIIYRLDEDGKGYFEIQ